MVCEEYASASVGMWSSTKDVMWLLVCQGKDLSLKGLNVSATCAFASLHVVDCYYRVSALCVLMMS